jgi:hypothetical protein
MLWDMIQQMQIGRTEEHAVRVDERLAAIERQLDRNSAVLLEVIKYLKERDGRDLDDDGEVG